MPVSDWKTLAAALLVALPLAACADAPKSDAAKAPEGKPAAAPAAPAAPKPTPPPAPPAAPAASATPAPPAPEKLADPAKLTAQAPAKFKARFETTEGAFVIEVDRAWAPNGADRFYNLVENGYFDDVAFFRAIQGFMVQFGIHGNPNVNKVWRTATIQDDPVKQSNTRGMVTFAKSGAPNSRTTQIFVNYVDNANLDGMGFAPFGKVVEGLDVLDKLHKGYGEGAPRGRGPDQFRLQTEGNAYLKASFPELDYVKTATIVK